MEFPIVSAAVAAAIALLQTGLMMAVGFSRLAYEKASETAATPTWS